MTAGEDTVRQAGRRGSLLTPRAMTATTIALIAFTAYTAYTAGASVMWVQDDEPLFADPARMATAGLGYRTELLQGLVPGAEVRLMWQPPGYPVLLSAWFRMFGSGLGEGRALSVVACALALTLVYLLARAHASQFASILAALAVAGTPWFAGAATTIRPDAVTVLCVVLTAFLLDRHLRCRKVWTLAAVGGAAVTAVLMHPLGAIAPVLVALALLSVRRPTLAVVFCLAVASLAALLWLPFVLDRWDLFLTQMGLQAERKPPFHPLALLQSEKRLVGYVPLVLAAAVISVARRWGEAPRVVVLGLVIALAAATVGAENQYPVYVITLGAPLVAIAWEAASARVVRRAVVAVVALLVTVIPAAAGLGQSIASQGDERKAQDAVRADESVFLGPGGAALYFHRDPARLRVFSPVPVAPERLARVLREQDVLVMSLPVPSGPRELVDVAATAPQATAGHWLGVWRLRSGPPR